MRRHRFPLSLDQSIIQRLFFALWPDDAIRSALAAASQNLPIKTGRHVPPDNLHITLVFLGSVSAVTRARIEQAAEPISIPAFDLVLDKPGWWPRPQVVWLGTSTIPEPLQELVTGLSKAIRPCGLKLDDRPHRPHVTLRRKVNGLPKLGVIDPITWNVRSFSLVQSQSAPSGVIYKVLRSWDLHE